MPPKRERPQTWYLTNTRGSHNKFYEVKLEKQSNRWTITTRYARIGQPGKATIRERSIYHSAMLRKAERMVQEKIGRGYELSSEQQKAELQVGDFEDRFGNLE